MKKITLLLYLALFSTLLVAQPNRDRMRDHIWLFGQNAYSTTPGRGVTKLEFMPDSLRMTKFYTRMNFGAYSTSLCDTLGNLQAYSNGIYIADSSRQKMMNGDSLDYGYFWLRDTSTGSSIIQGAGMILPALCHENCATMIYNDRELSSSNRSIDVGIKAAQIDFSSNHGLGRVTHKDIQLVLDSTQGTFATACRHANGRDWWIISPRVGLNGYHRRLLTPYGIISYPMQTMPAVWACALRGKHACFSPDGRQYAHFDSRYAVWLYDFDRCTGLLSNRRALPVDTSSVTGAIFAGIAFSPNSRYLYQTNAAELRQFDTQAANVAASMQIVATYDGFTYPFQGANLKTKFNIPQLAPDNKIYINCAGGHYLHVIDNPDAGGTACNVLQHQVRLPTYYYATMPNFPYFRLGAERGTVCDSLGIETGVTVGTSNPQNPPLASLLRAYPNPTTGLFYIENLPENATVRVYDALGKEVFAPFAAYKNEINLNNAPKGVYFCSVFVHKKYFKTLKIVKIE